MPKTLRQIRHNYLKTMKRKSILLILAIAIISTGIGMEAQAFQEKDENSVEIKMVQGYRLKIKQDKKKNVNIDYNESGDKKGLDIGLAISFGKIYKYCKPKNRKECPLKHL